MTTVLVPFFRYVKKIEFSSPVLFFKLSFGLSLFGGMMPSHHVTVPALHGPSPSTSTGANPSESLFS